MPEEESFCSECHHEIPAGEHNWNTTDAAPLCYECWTELDEIRDVFEQELDAEVERLR